ncbi:MAG: hypothetical protein ACKV2T_02585 [Kofleriaceae bacterium]
MSHAESLFLGSMVRVSLRCPPDSTLITHGLAFDQASVVMVVEIGSFATIARHPLDCSSPSGLLNIPAPYGVELAAIHRSGTRATLFMPKGVNGYIGIHEVTTNGINNQHSSAPFVYSLELGSSARFSDGTATLIVEPTLHGIVDPPRKVLLAPAANIGRLRYPAITGDGVYSVIEQDGHRLLLYRNTTGIQSDQLVLLEDVAKTALLDAIGHVAGSDRFPVWRSARVCRLDAGRARGHADWCVGDRVLGRQQATGPKRGRSRSVRAAADHQLLQRITPGFDTPSPSPRTERSGCCGRPRPRSDR